MNQGNIPGYYYDREKNKYFRIQPNHVVSPNVKYSVSNVKQEERSSKKLKLEQQQQAIKRKQTIGRLPSIQQPLLIGTGLQREQGQNNGGSYDVSRDCALVNGFECAATKGLPAADSRAGYRIFDHVAVPDTNTKVLACRSAASQHYFLFEGPDVSGLQPGPSQPMHVFRDQITHLAVQKVSESNWLLACSSEPNLDSGNVFITLLDLDLDFDTDRPGRPRTPLRSSGPSLRLGVGQRGEMKWASRLLPGTDIFASAGSRSVNTCSMFSPQSLTSHTLATHEESAAVDWLGPHTLAFSIRTDTDPHESQRAPRRRAPPAARKNPELRDGRAPQEVRLWDTRSHGVATRLRMPSRVTGLDVPDRLPDSPAYAAHQLLVADVHGLALYDLRFAKTTAPPVLEIEHRSQGDRLAFATLPACSSGGRAGIVAALDEKCQAVETYSLRGGKRIRTLRPEPQGPGDWRLSGLRWCEDAWGVPFLQACVDSTVLQWTW